MLTVFTRPLCAMCAVMSQWLQDLKIAYREIDVTAVPEARRILRGMTRGSMSVPTLLLEDGHEVQGLARSAPEGSWEHTAPGFTFVPGDIRQEGLEASAMAGCEVVIHAASSFTAEDDPESVMYGSAV